MPDAISIIVAIHWTFYCDR